jgi:hypothetical protein
MIVAAEASDVDVGDSDNDVGNVLPWPSASRDVNKARIHEVIKRIMKGFLCLKEYQGRGRVGIMFGAILTVEERLRCLGRRKLEFC